MVNNRQFQHARGMRAPLIQAGFALLPCLAIAQDTVGTTRAWTIEPSVSLRETFTDNYAVSSNKESDAITEAAAGIYVTANGGMLRGYLDYTLTGEMYARHNDSNELRHYLRTNSTAELIPGFAFVDLFASYNQQVISAFGSQSPYRGLDNNNQADEATIAITPSLRGRLGGLARYEARVYYEMTRAKGIDSSDVDTLDASLRLDGDIAGSRLGWTANASHNNTDYVVGRRTYDDRVYAGVNYQFTPELKVGVRGGQERTDLLTLQGDTYTTWGFGVDWKPSERTALEAGIERRFFGNAHYVNFSHRTPNTVWTLSDRRDLNSSERTGFAGLGSAYDLFFRQFASAQPDAVQRDLMVRNYLQTNGIDPREVVLAGFLASAVTVDSGQELSVALVGVRNTVTLRAGANRSERVDQLSTSFDDLSTTSIVHERAVSLDWAYRLTPTSVINLAGSYRRNDGDLSTQQTTLKEITAAWSTPLGARSTMSAGARYARFDSATAPYTENAVFAAVRLAF
jgi:uncharacterized protein (PEP-CTERM system associated)